ncbi:hypothetical protein ACFMQL_39230 [Nonomuraea fastidiosa]|uniref:hypothetical protein n=1 Tax=Nonomuraea TaxID=83681 RepID=UPI0032565FE5
MDGARLGQSRLAAGGGAGGCGERDVRRLGQPTLAPIESSQAFLAAYQEARGRAFTGEEREVAWAASLWTAAHNARYEALYGHTPVSGDAVRAQAAERLRRANA